jgi:putative oxidoreductase
MNALGEAVKTYGPLAGRILLALIFVISGYNKLVGFDGTVGYIASKGLPLPQLAAAAAIAIELVGGVLLVIGWQTRWAATAIFLFMIPTTLIFHAFWAAPAANLQMETIQFMKNLCIMGGMLYVMAFGAGPLSVDNRKRA